MARWTIIWLQKINPQRRLLWSARIFWWTILLGILSVVFLCDTWFQRILMIISWGAITITAVDIISTTDVRQREDEI